MQQTLSLTMRMREGCAGGGKGPLLSEDKSLTLGCNNDQVLMTRTAFSKTADCLTAAYGTKWNGNASAENGSLFAKTYSAVRRLTPTECERLQGFYDGYTDIPGASDTARYKALGNSMCVNVMQWIAQRMLEVDNKIAPTEI